MTLKVLIAEDSPAVAEVVAFGAQMAWPDCDVMIATSGEEALRLFYSVQPDLIVLDIEMPPPNGLEVCGKIRQFSSVPILMLTVRDAIEDKVGALNMGADDYLTKPFHHHELLARMRALVRRATGVLSSGSLASGSLSTGSLATRTPATGSLSTSEATISAGDVVLNPTTHEVRVNDKPVTLTSTEYRLLEELVRHAGTALSHRALLERVWGPQYANELQYLKVFVRRLRHKLGDDAERPRYIQTEWGIGYRFAAG